MSRAAPSRLLALLLCALTLLSGCERSYRSMAAERAVHAARNAGPIVVAAIADHREERRGYLDGVRLAVEEINAAGGVLGRMLEVRIHNESPGFRESLPMIRSIAADPGVTAVLGHRTSSIAVPASIVYEEAQLLFLPSFATDTTLTGHGFRHVLRTLPDSRAMADQSASVAALLGYKSVAVLHSRADYSRKQAFLFEDAARREGIDVAFRGSFFGNEQGYRDLIGRMHAVDFDAIYLASGVESGARMIRQLREMGMDQPVIGSDEIRSEALATLAGPAADLTIAPTIYDVNDPAPRNRAFIAAYRERRGDAPNEDVAQGYDAAHLFAQIVRQAGSVAPAVLASKAHYIAPVAGVTGLYAYDEHGDLYGNAYKFEIMRGGRWRALKGLEAPHRLANYHDLLRRRALEEQTETAQTAATETATETPAPAAAPAAAPEDPRQALLLRDRRWLALAQDMLGFRALGIVIPDATEGEALVNIAEALGEDAGFAVEACRLPASGGAGGDSETLEALALRCYSRMTPRIDAMLIIPDLLDLDAETLRRLNRGLLAYRIPSLALMNEVREDYGLSHAIVSAGAGLDPTALGRLLDGALKDMRAFELVRRLKAVPSVLVDLDAAARLRRPLGLRQISVISRPLSFGTAPRETARADGDAPVGDES